MNHVIISLAFWIVSLKFCCMLLLNVNSTIGNKHEKLCQASWIVSKWFIFFSFVYPYNLIHNKHLLHILWIFLIKIENKTIEEAINNSLSGSIFLFISNQSWIIMNIELYWTDYTYNYTLHQQGIRVSLACKKLCQASLIGFNCRIE